jgi:hypothetical protein
MRWGLLAAALLSGSLARADGLDAATTAAIDVHPLTTLGTFVGLSGGVKGLQLTGTEVGWPRSFFAYANYDWSASSLEAGGGVRFDLIGPLKASVAAGGILVPRFGVSGGGRLTALLSARFGEQFFITPALGASFGVVSTHPVTWLLPVEASAQVGYSWRFVSLFLRLALGAETLAGPMVSLRADAAVGVSFWIIESKERD